MTTVGAGSTDTSWLNAGYQGTRGGAAPIPVNGEDRLEEKERGDVAHEASSPPLEEGAPQLILRGPNCLLLTADVCNATAVRRTGAPEFTNRPVEDT
jgi:hypothetical protein